MGSGAGHGAGESTCACLLPGQRFREVSSSARRAHEILMALPGSQRSKGVGGKMEKLARAAPQSREGSRALLLGGG